MQFHLQDAAALSLVAIAGLYLLVVAWRSVTSRRVTGCGTACSGCPSSKRPEKIEPSLVAIEVNPRREMADSTR